MSLEGDLINAFLESDGKVAARAIEALPIESVQRTIELAAPRSAASLLGSLSPPLAVNVLSRLQAPRSSALLAELPLVTAAALLRRISEEARRPMLAGMPSKLVDAIGRLLHAQPGTAGALMDPLAQSVFQDVSIRVARQEIQRHGQDSFYYVYVIDRGQMLVGVVTIKRLLLSRAEDPVASIMQRTVISIPANTSVSVLRRHAAWANLDALPVVDRNGLFIGAVRHRDLRRLLPQPADTALWWGPGVSLMRDVGSVFWLGLYSAIRSGFPDPSSNPPAGTPSGSSS